MSESLRDQLLKSGLVKTLKSESPSRSTARPGGPRPAHHHGGKPPRERTASGEPDLAQAYAQRARLEREERERAQREAEQRAREKRERKTRLANLLQGKALNAADAEHPRHFPHGGKIRRVYCTAEQLVALNRGELGVVQKDGRYLIVTRDTAEQAAAIAADALVLLVDPNAPPDDDVPPDLMW